MSKRELATLADKTPMVQLASVIPKDLHVAVKCQAIKDGLSMRGLVAKYLAAGLKASRA